MTDGTNGVSFTTKEMLIKLETKIDGIDAKLDRKVDRDAFDRVYSKVEQAADRAQVSALEAKFSALETQIRTQDKINEALAKKTLETEARSATNFTRGEKIIATLLGLVALGIQIFVVTGGVN